ncbi:glutamine synthetase family protein [Leptolyngbya ohadii]|uniref:glutamine synthetase family protein n=1 Tax=Leptolyngbya ohadii TaxID=1962290 RepID=UPI000B59B6A7|nr:glutamine synthetase family protein [Leptolyngbya ohadii]
MTQDWQELLGSAAVRFVRIVWCDNANVIRAKAFHTAFLEEHKDWGIGISIAQQAVPVMYDAPALESGLGPVGEAWLVPDWSTFARLPYAPSHARVMGTMMRDGQPWALCPRSFLQRMIAQSQAVGLDVKAAFENEFYLLSPSSDGIKPVDRTLFAASLGMDQNHAVIDDITDALIAQGIAVERYYPESGHGQHEISVRYTDAMAAADQQIAFRETVRGVALQHGLIASFVPKLFADQAGSGCHLHLSLWRQGENLMPNRQNPGELSPLAQSFIAGILDHLPALMAITTPSINSYRRLQPHFWSGAFRCWGHDNREAAVRIPSSPSQPSPTHLELKTVDASANPYLALGATIAAGLNGIKRGLILPNEVTRDPGTFSESERRERQIDRLPTTLGEAIDHLKQDTHLLNALGSPLAQAFLAVRQAEWAAMQGMTLEEEVEMLVERY